MSLNKIVAEATEAHEANGVIDRHSAINAAVPQVLADQEMTEMCVRGHLSKMIANSVKARAKSRATNDERQISLFGLRDAHVIGDGEGIIKRTEALTRIEFEGLIQVRQEQVNADIAYLTRLREAARLTRAIWNQHPGWTWGQVEAEYSRRLPSAVNG